jgi:hypothetical protein
VGLNSRFRYRLRFNDRSAPDQVVDGNELMKAGLKVRLPIPNSSEIIFLEELSAQRSSSQADGSGGPALRGKIAAQ